MKKQGIFPKIIFAFVVLCAFGSSFVYSDSAPIDDLTTRVLWHCDQTYTSGSDIYVPDDNNNTSRFPFDLKLTQTASGEGMPDGSEQIPTLTTGNGGKFGEALVFDGNDYAWATRAWVLTDSVKVDFWMNVEELPSSSGADLSRVLRTSAWSVNINDSDEVVFTTYSKFDGVWGPDGELKLSISGKAGQWIHVVATCDTDLSISLTVDGTTITGTATQKWYMSTGDGIAVGHLNGQPVEEAFEGMLDEIKVSVPTDTSEFLAHPQVDEDLAVFGLWHMDEITLKDGNDAVLDDDSNSVIPRDHDMLLIASTFGGGIVPVIDGNEKPQPPASDPNEFGSSMYFDGWDDLFLEADVGSQDMLGIQTNNLRMETWCKFSQDYVEWEDTAAWLSRMIWFDPQIRLSVDRYFKSDGSTDFYQFLASFRLNDASGGYLGQYSVYYRFYGEPTFLTSWHHVAGEYERGVMRLYIDGRLVHCRNDLPEDAVIRSGLLNRPRIGQRHWGWIDEAKISRASGDCGDWGFLSGDINHDCRVDLLDLAGMAQNWMFCTDPTDDNCIQL